MKLTKHSENHLSAELNNGRYFDIEIMKELESGAAVVQLIEWVDSAAYVSTMDILIKTMEDLEKELNDFGTYQNISDKEYYDRLTKASNRYNIQNKINIDHHTITAFMGPKEKIQHLLRLESA